MKIKKTFHSRKLSIAIAIVLSPISVYSQVTDLSTLDGTNGFVINGGDTAFEGSGYSVSSAGDINGDGIKDIVIGATAAKTPDGVQSGASYIIFGHDAPFNPSIDVDDINGINGFVIYGANSNDRFGHSANSIGDINGDGIDDLMIGASLVDTGAVNAGACYVLFGSNSEFPSSLDATSIVGDTGFVINGIAMDDRAGYAVSAAGDINGDGIDDMLIGVRMANPNGNSSGAAYVVFGNNSVSGFPDSFSFSDLDGNNGFTLTSGDTSRTRFGVSVNFAGDVNDDQIDDMIIGAGATGPNHSGSAYIVFGSANTFPLLMNLTGLNGNNGFILNGVAANNRAGYSVSSAGDVNGDDLDDIVVGAFGAGANGNYSGSSYIVFGQSTGFPASIEAANLDGVNGFTLTGTNPEDQLGRSVSTAGDFNHDGIDDLIIGANGFDADNKDKSGAAYLVFGNSSGFNSVINASSLTGEQGRLLKGVAAGDEAGISANSAGDINNDGVDDIIIGAWRADPNGVNSAGSSYLVFGNDLVFKNGFE